MNKFQLKSIGTVKNSNEGTVIELDSEYIPALEALDGFSHINVLWWFDGCDNEMGRNILQVNKPYKNSPEVMGIFATRSPARPNPIALTASEIIDIDYEKGIIRVTFLDADDATPVLDIKPYTPSLDRVETPKTPEWCREWPKSTETSGCFDWSKIFNF